MAVSWPDLMRNLAQVREARTGRCSSWDREGRNSDYCIIPAGQTKVLADIAVRDVATFSRLVEVAKTPAQ